MSVSLIIFCSCLSPACSTCNLSFQSLASSVSHFESLHDAKNHEDVLIGLAHYSQLLRMRKNAAAPLPTRHHLPLPCPLQLLWVIHPWIALGRGRGWAHCELRAGRPMQVLLDLSNTAASSPALNFPA